MDICQITNITIREKWQSAQWQGAPSKIDFKAILIWFSIAFAFIGLGVLLFFLIPLQGVNIIVLIVLVVLGLPFLFIPFLINKTQIYAVGKNAIYFTNIFAAQNKGFNGSWFEENYDNISGCDVHYSMSKKRATFIFRFIKSANAGTMGELTKISFYNISNPEKLIEVLRGNGVNCIKR